MGHVSARQRLIISICGPSGAGKSQLAKAVVTALGDDRAVRIPGDYYLRSADQPTTIYVTKPNDYDWPLLDRILALPDGTELTAPDFDYQWFVRLTESGGPSFTMRPIALLDTIFPYPRADLTILLTAPAHLRQSRVAARDIDWGSNVAGRWRQLEVSRRLLERLPAQFDLHLSGEDDSEENAAKIIGHLSLNRRL